MEIKLKLDANRILHKEFAGTKPGYDGLAVDTFLDLVIKDYEQMEKFIRDVKKEEEEYKDKIAFLQDTISKLKAENASLKSKLSGIKNNSDASINNLELLKRISALEMALSKAGIDPNSI